MNNRSQTCHQLTYKTCFRGLEEPRRTNPNLKPIIVAGLTTTPQGIHVSEYFWKQKTETWFSCQNARLWIFNSTLIGTLKQTEPCAINDGICWMSVVKLFGFKMLGLNVEFVTGHLHNRRSLSVSDDTFPHFLSSLIVLISFMVQLRLTLQPAEHSIKNSQCVPGQTMSYPGKPSETAGCLLSSLSCHTRISSYE